MTLSLNIDIYYLSEAHFRLSTGLFIDSALKQSDDLTG